MSINTGKELAGPPHRELIDASHDAEHTSSGAVAAYRNDRGGWNYVPAGQEELYRSRGFDVVSVYIEECSE